MKRNYMKYKSIRSRSVAKCGLMARDFVEKKKIENKKKNESALKGPFTYRFS